MLYNQLLNRLHRQSYSCYFFKSLDKILDIEEFLNGNLILRKEMTCDEMRAILLDMRANINIVENVVQNTHYSKLISMIEEM